MFELVFTTDLWRKRKSHAKTNDKQSHMSTFVLSLTIARGLVPLGVSMDLGTNAIIESWWLPDRVSLCLTELDLDEIPHDNDNFF